MNKPTIFTIILVFLLVGGIIFIQANAIASKEDSIFIGERTTLYIQTGCSHCEKQVSIFGENKKYLNIIDCLQGDNLQKCKELGIITTPTWIIDNQKYEGFQSLRQLKNLISKNYLRDIYGNVSKVPISEINKSCPFNLTI